MARVNMVNSPVAGGGIGADERTVQSAVRQSAMGSLSAKPRPCSRQIVDRSENLRNFLPPRPDEALNMTTQSPESEPAPELNPDGRIVFFILGCQKSGTTWVQKLLDSHPNACCGGEGHLTDLLIPLLQQGVNVYNARQMERSEPHRVLLDESDVIAVCRFMSGRLLARHCAGSPDSSAIQAVGDKTPEYAADIRLLNRLYPAARFIHVIRDGRDAAVSGWAHIKRQQPQQKSDAGSAFASFAEYAGYFAAKHWRPLIEAARSAAAELGDRYLELRYEDLHAEPIKNARRAIAFLGLPDDDEIVQACLDRSSFGALSGGRAPGEEDPQSFYRKGVVGDWRSHFDDESLARFDEHAGDLLDELGYRTPATVRA
jgi:hypothetical protein